MRRRIAATLLMASVIVWGVWFGGQIFNAFMVVPKWGASPPATMVAYNAISSRGRLPFFRIFNPLFVVLVLASAIAAWPSAAASRKWLACSAVCALGALALVLYMAPYIWRTFAYSEDGALAAAEILARVEWWKALNWTRLAVELVGFTAAVVALRVWSSEAEPVPLRSQADGGSSRVYSRSPGTRTTSFVRTDEPAAGAAAPTADR